MSVNRLNIGTSISTGEDFVLMIRRESDSELIDLSGWGASYVGRVDVNSANTLFNYTEADNVELGVFDLNGVDQNIKLTIPFAKTLEFRALNLSEIHIGLYLTPPESETGVSPIQVITDATLTIKESVAP